MFINGYEDGYLFCLKPYRAKLAKGWRGGQCNGEEDDTGGKEGSEI
jgi:hypothetical protein